MRKAHCQHLFGLSEFSRFIILEATLTQFFSIFRENNFEIKQNFTAYLKKIKLGSSRANQAEQYKNNFLMIPNNIQFIRYALMRNELKTNIPLNS